jgi:hypothetical protein
MKGTTIVEKRILIGLRKMMATSGDITCGVNIGCKYWLENVYHSYLHIR